MHNVSLTRTLTFTLVACALLAAACNSSRTSRHDASVPAAGSTAAATSAPSATSRQSAPIESQPGSGGNSLLIADSGGTLRAVRGDGQTDWTAAAGVPAPDWSALYTAESAAGNGKTATIVKAVDPRTGQSLRSVTLDGRYVLPAIGPGPSRGGLSPNGGWLALEAPRPNGPYGASSESRFAVLQTAFTGQPKLLYFSGDFEFDGLDNAGRWLYLIEYLKTDATGAYHVRRYDLARAALDPGIVADKARLEETMHGMRLAAVPSLAGEWLYSLYVEGSNKPFIHALNLDQGYAVCIDLPSSGDYEQQLLWSIVLAPHGRSLYAVNAALGTAVEIETGQTTRILRTTSFAITRAPTKDPLDRLLAWLAPSVEAKRLITNGAAITPDGKLLYALGAYGAISVDTGSLAVRGRYLTDTPLDSLVLSADGRSLYALSTASGKVTRIDTATGAPLGETPLTAGNALLGVLPPR